MNKKWLESTEKEKLCNLDLNLFVKHNEDTIKAYLQETSCLPIKSEA